MPLLRGIFEHGQFFGAPRDVGTNSAQFCMEVGPAPRHRTAQATTLGRAHRIELHAGGAGP